jgi:GAF domain
MEEREAIVAELVSTRERAAALIRAKLEALSSGLREATTRTVAELDLVLPPDLEVLFPLSSLDGRLESLTHPVVAATPSLECLRRLDAGRSQSEVLQELLGSLETWCGARAIVVFRDGQVAGWSGAGFADQDPVRTWRGAIADSTAFQHVVDGKPVVVRPKDDSVLSSWLPDGEGRVLVVPMSLRGKVVGALVALEDERGLVLDTIQLLTFLAGLLLETLTVRPTVPSASLLDAVDMAGEAPAPVVEEPVAAPAVVPGEEVSEEPAAIAEAPEVAEAEPAPPAEVEPAGEGEAAAPPEVEAAEEAAEPEGAATPAEAVAPVPAAERPADEERRHEEARRFARLLVSEIRLYNEQAVQEGRNAGDIYRRLKEDIDRSREMYEQRVPAEVRADSNYFFEEMVRILGDGDPDALGL